MAPPLENFSSSDQLNSPATTQQLCVPMFPHEQ